MENTPDPITFKLGVIEGRMGAVEERLGRHENIVSVALEKIGKQMESFTTETRVSHGALAKQIDKIESKIDREEGARAQVVEDNKAAEKRRTATETTFFSKENLRLGRATLIVMLISAVVGVLGQAHFHFLAPAAH